MESSGGPVLQQRGPAASARKLRRVMRAVYVVLVKQHQPKLAALGVHLHRMLSGDRLRRGLSLSCRAMDPAAAVVHPLPRGHGGGHRRRPSGSLSSLSCRSMDPAAAVRQYQYRPREVQFSCKSTPLHKRRRAQRRAMRLQPHDLQGREDHSSSSDTEYYGSAAAVTRLFALMDVEEETAKETDVVDLDDGDLEYLETSAAWPALSPAPRQITDSPFHVREEDNEVDRRADEFITWFHEQLRTQQQRAAHYWVR